MPRLAAAVLVLLATAGSALADKDPWAPSKDGKIECFSSNMERKTCQAMNTYRWIDDTRVVGEGRGYIPDFRTDIVVIASWEAEIKGDRNCFVSRESDWMKVRFEKDGKPLPAEEAEDMRKKALAAMKENFGRKFCIRLGKYGREYTAQMSVDDTEIPSASNWVAWIDPSEGFTLSP